MQTLHEGALLWEPSPTTVERANLSRFMCWLTETRDLHFEEYATLWQWSVDEPEAFWGSLIDYFDIVVSSPARRVLGRREMPGAEWFPGMTLNWAENILAKRTDERPMLLFKAEDQPLRTVEWGEIEEQVNRLAAYLRRIGVGKGDRVVAYLPNVTEAIVAVLASASIGAIWSSCSPDFGSRSVLERFTQIEPAVLIAVNGYRYGGKLFDRSSVVRELQDALPSLKQTIIVPHEAAGERALDDAIIWSDALTSVEPTDEIAFEQVAFDHPLWVLYSSGTTGLPKPIVHGHGGITVEHAKSTAFHNDLGPDDRFFWYTSTGWMMWNYLLGGLLSGATIVLYDGSPGYPDLNALWRLAEQAGVTYFGTSAAFISACIKANLHPARDVDLSRLRAIGSTGSPLSIDGFAWIYQRVSSDADPLALESLSGGTDLCTAFVGGARVLPIYAGELQGASLGANVQAFDDSGAPVIGEVGELVIAAPMPSMPLFFWGDEDEARYRESYFETFPGVWRHGDWIKINERGGCVIYGRSDSTINRQGVRMGTSEIYRAVEALPEIRDSLIIDLELLGREPYMPLFIVLREGCALDDGLRTRIKSALRTHVSPRHVPNEVIAIDEVPYTLSGKKMESPIRRVLLGHDVDRVVNRGAMRNPNSLAFFQEFAEMLNKRTRGE